MIRTYYDATSVTGETGGNITGRQSEFPKVDRWPCQMFWRRLNIGDDGTVRYCTDDWHNKTKLGDLRVQGIAEIWTSPAYDTFRHLHMTRQFGQNAYCAKCTEWQGMTWNYDYFTAMEKMLGKKFVG
jgi:radical SAM protein with 4Fe4S-binding SPASM domain